MSGFSAEGSKQLIVSKLENWTIQLNNHDAIDNALDAIERNPVAAKVNLMLKQKGRTSNGTRLTHSQAVRLVHLVKSKNGVDWSLLSLNFTSECPHLLFCTTQLAPLFSKISASAHDRATQSSNYLPLLTANSILNALQYGNRLRELSLWHCIIQEDRMELLSQGIQSNSCPLRSLQLYDVECDDSVHVENENCRSEHFLLALAKNTTLEDVSFMNSFTSTQDVTLVDLVYRMSNTQKPRWKTLCLEGADLEKSAQVQDQTVVLVDSLTHMLGHQQCSIVELSLHGCSLGVHYNVHGRTMLQSLMLGLQENSSVQVLSLDNNGFDFADLKYILDGIVGCRNLRELELSEEDLSFNEKDKENMTWLTNSRIVLPHPRTELRKLWIFDHLPYRSIYDDDEDDGDDFDCYDDDAYAYAYAHSHAYDAYDAFRDADSSGTCDRSMSDTKLEEALLPLLLHNPLIYELGGYGVNWKEMPRAAELLDLNQCVGPLRAPLPLEQGQGADEASHLSRIPRSLWPVVLERTNNTLKDPARCANVVYHILKQGPGLLDY
ncbi:unnamed protein product [Cylindrotheca closterium]|uniref:Uncharacterized protein n=1 Tax=Cylindrotheca closterium TaxID=2856 RepID=A0AAD2G8Y0_9STRA|nr:unnamed protein product [Cylindrotheca closterium]